jgi:MoxR domain in the MoxR-vWA-beta-propeller ternary systems
MDVPDLIKNLAKSAKEDKEFSDGLTSLIKMAKFGNISDQFDPNGADRFDGDIDKLNRIIKLIRSNRDLNSKKRHAAVWDVSKLESEIKSREKFDTLEWTVALHFLQPNQLVQLYQHSLKRLRNVKERLGRKLVSLQPQISMMICGAIAQEPTLFLGPPGFAKTVTAESFFEELGLSNVKENGSKRYFEYLLTKFTIPEELFGPYHIPSMLQGRMIRINQGMLTGKGVRAAFIDEVFKANSAILHTLLSLLAMRKFYSEGKPVKSDLAIILMASNEKPASEELAAIYDRISLRLYFPELEGKDIEEDHKRIDEYIAIINRSWSKTKRKINTNYGTIEDIAEEFNCQELLDYLGSELEFKPAACINDALLLSRVLSLVPIRKGNGNSGHPAFDHLAPNGDFFRAFTKIRRTLSSGAYCLLSGRKVEALHKLARAHALFNSDKPAEAADCAVFKYVWEDHTYRESLESHVDSVIANLTSIKPSKVKA